MGCPAFWDDLRFNLQPEINMYNSKKIKIMDALFWIYIISVVAFFVKEEKIVNE